MKKINVNLYGGKGLFGGREHPLEAETIYCDKTDNCSLYKKKQCLNVRAPSLFSKNCKFGKVEYKKGFTSRAAKYHKFKEKYKNDKLYNVLSFPYKCRLAIIDDYVFFDAPHIKYDSDNKVGGPWSDGENKKWFTIDEFNVDLLEDVCRFRPKALTGEEIISYQEKEVPEILFQLYEIFPCLYASLVERIPEYNKSFDYIGKEAYVKTLKDGVILETDRGDFKKQDGFLICDEYHVLFGPFGVRNLIAKVPITDDLVAKITSNDQVDKDTVFK